MATSHLVHIFGISSRSVIGGRTRTRLNRRILDWWRTYQDSNPGFRLRKAKVISRLHYTSLLDAEAHSSRRLQSIRAVEHTSHIDVVYAQFFVSIQNRNGHRSTIGPFDFQALHLAFSEEVEIPSRMELVLSLRPTCRAVWSEWLDQLHGAIHAQTCACRELHLVTTLDAIQS